MLKQIDFVNSDFSGNESERMELLHDCGVSNAAVFNKHVRLALDGWYVDELLTVINPNADQNVTKEPLSKISCLATISRVYMNRKQLSKARPFCVECYRCATQFMNASSSLLTSNADATHFMMPRQALVFEAASRLAQTYDGLEELSLARTVHDEILEISVKFFGNENHLTLHARHCYASHLRSCGSFQTALVVAESVLLVRESSDKNSPDVATSAELLGLIFEDLNQFDQALLFHQRALDIRRQHLLRDHEMIWSSMNSIARTMLQQHAPAQAEVFLRQVFESTSRVLGEHDLVSLIAAEKLADCLNLLHLNAEALSMQLKTLHGYRSIISADNAEVVDTLKKVAVTYCSLGKRQVMIFASFEISSSHQHFRMDWTHIISPFQAVKKFTG